MALTLPDDLVTAVMRQAAKLGFNDPVAYVRALVNADLINSIGAPASVTFHNERELEEMLVAGLESSPGIEMTPEDWHQLRNRLTQKYSKSQS